MLTLSEADRRAYEANGYVTPGAPLPERLFTRMPQGVQRLLDDNPNVRPEQLAGAHVQSASRPIRLVRGVDRAGNDSRAGHVAAWYNGRPPGAAGEAAEVRVRAFAGVCCSFPRLRGKAGMGGAAARTLSRQAGEGPFRLAPPRVLADAGEGVTMPTPWAMFQRG